MRKIRLAHIERNKYQKRDKCYRNSRPTKQERLKEEKIFCSECGEELTSERSKRLGIGQRCKWKLEEIAGTRVYRKTKGPHMKEDVDFKPLGTKVKSGVIVMYQQTKLGDWD